MKCVILANLRLASEDCELLLCQRRLGLTAQSAGRKFCQAADCVHISLVEIMVFLMRNDPQGAPRRATHKYGNHQTLDNGGLQFAQVMEAAGRIKE